MRYVHIFAVYSCGRRNSWSKSEYKTWEYWGEGEKRERPFLELG